MPEVTVSSTDVIFNGSLIFLYLMMIPFSTQMMKGLSVYFNINGTSTTIHTCKAFMRWKVSSQIESSERSNSEQLTERSVKHIC